MDYPTLHREHCNYRVIVLFEGSTGTTFTGLSVGDHVIVIRFTPDGSSQPTTLNPPLTFTIAADPPTPTPSPGDFNIATYVATY